MLCPIDAYPGEAMQQVCVLDSEKTSVVSKIVCIGKDWSKQSNFSLNTKFLKHLCSAARIWKYLLFSAARSNYSGQISLGFKLEIAEQKTWQKSVSLTPNFQQVSAVFLDLAPGRGSNEPGEKPASWEFSQDLTVP